VGVQQAVLTDLEGQRWVVCEHLPDTDPADWYGAVLGPVPGRTHNPTGEQTKLPYADLRSDGAVPR
jgi:hypothetical protein